MRWSPSEGISVAVGLPMERMAEAMACVAAWRADPDAPCNCPVCAAVGLEIIDQSARPYSEWYVLKCAACGLDATLQIPMRGPQPT
jgi:hypothetical protein